MQRIILVLTIAICCISATLSAQSLEILFLHHSTGQNLVEQGDVRGLIESYNSAHSTDYRFWDHGYNGDGLRNPAGEWLGWGYDVPDDNTYACGLRALFGQPVHLATPDNAFSEIMANYDVFLFKSCFPGSNVEPEDTAYSLTDSCYQSLYNYKRIYRYIRQVCDGWHNKIFIALTPPPQVMCSTDPEQAARARHFANWLADTFLTEAGGNHPNIFVFDFFDRLADPSPGSSNYNTLRTSYQGGDPCDGHPNELANQTIAPAFVQVITDAIAAYPLTSARFAPPPHAPKLTLWPNPTTGPLYWNRPELGLRVLDVMGQDVLRLGPSGQGSLEGLTDGVYFAVPLDGGEARRVLKAK